MREGAAGGRKPGPRREAETLGSLKDGGQCGAESEQGIKIDRLKIRFITQVLHRFVISY